MVFGRHLPALGSISVIMQACQDVEAWHVISITICQSCSVAVPIDGPEIGMRGFAGASTCSITLLNVDGEILDLACSLPLSSSQIAHCGHPVE